MGYPNLELSINQSNPSLSDLRACNKLIQLAKSQDFKTVYARPRQFQWENLEIWSFCDAAHGILERKEKSSEGRLIFLVDKEQLWCHPLSWKSSVLKTVCRDVKSAETRALNNALDECMYIRDIFQSVFHR